MGLDYSVYLCIRDKETKLSKWNIEIAYWRKAYGIKDVLQDIARKPLYMISYTDDYFTVCNTSVLREVIKEFISSLSDINNDMWVNSIWTPVETRDQTIKNIGTIYAAISWIDNSDDFEAFELMFYSSADKDTSILESYIKDKDKYEIVIAFENSY